MQMPPAAPVAARPTITVLCRFFARYAEIVGRSEVVLELSAGATVADAVAQLRGTVSRADQLPDHPMTAVNLQHVRGSRTLAQGDELALLPPLAGG